MTKAERIKKAAIKTVAQLKALQELIGSLADGIPPPKVLSRRKKSVKRKPVAKKRAKRTEAYDTSLWDFVAD